MNDVGNELLEKIVAASGLSPIFGRGAIARALRRAGVREDELTRQAARAAMPEIRRAIEPFMHDRTDEVMKTVAMAIE